MNVWVRAEILARFLHWRLTWDHRDTHLAPPESVAHNPKFLSAWDAAGLIPDGALLADSGLACTQRCCIMYWAIQERFQQNGHPCNLSLVGVGGHGGRGKVPGTLEELGIEGLVTRFFTGHTETYKSFLKLAEAGTCEMQVIPQGTLALLLEAQGEGRDHLISDTGVGTAFDPRTGRGTPLAPPDTPQYVAPTDDGQLRWSIPPVTAAIFNLPAADAQGNLYVKNAAMIAESREIARAARRNGGVAIANVGLLVEEGYDEVFLRHDEVDAIVYDPNTEQTGSVPHRRYWDFLTPNSSLDVKEGMARVLFINRLVGVTPVRKPAELVMARLAAAIYTEHAQPGGIVDIGVGLPEEVARMLHEHGVLDQVTPMTETGVIGGMAAPGIYFGSAVNPTEIVSSAEAFRRMYKHLDAVILGMLEADGEGNVNVSKRGEGPMNYVGPGGFVDITRCADSIIFIGSWMAHSDVRLQGHEMRVLKAGPCKFVERVTEVTFSGQEALARGKLVYYITNIGVFRLTERGMELQRIMPGIDLERDVRGVCKMPFVLPESGPPAPVPEDVMTGRGFRLALASQEAAAT